ncbi:MAG: Twitching motility protein PilT, partial [uncultured Sphingomonadaceae bacterium]
ERSPRHPPQRRRGQGFRHPHQCRGPAALPRPHDRDAQRLPHGHARGGNPAGQGDDERQALGRVRGEARQRLLVRDPRPLALPRQRPLPAQQRRALHPNHQRQGSADRATAAAGDLQQAHLPAARPDPGHRPHRLGQEHYAGGHDRLDQPARAGPHHHARGPDRVRVRQQQVRDRAARGRL